MLGAKAEDIPDYLLYDVPVGDEYARVNSPHVSDKLTTRINIGYSPNPYVSMGRETGEILEAYIEHLGHFDMSVHKSFGKNKIHPFASLNAAAQKSSGTRAPQEFFQTTDVIAGIAIGSEGEFETAFGGVKSFDVVNKESTNGVMLSAGVSKEKYGVAVSAITHDVSGVALETSFGTYVGTEKHRLNLEYTARFTQDQIPSQVTIATRSKVGKFIVMPAFSFGTNSNLGSSANFMLSITMDLGKKKQSIVEEVKAEKPQEKPIIEEEVETTETTEEKVTIEELIKGDVIEVPVQDTTDETIVDSDESGTVSNKKLTKRSKSNLKRSSGEKTMEDPIVETKTESYETQPAAAVSPEQLAQLSQSTGDNGTLGLLLAIVAVVGGGAAWKFYTQYSEQKHEQKMKQLELEAKANGLGAAQPPPCQAANAKIEVELKEMKAKLANVDKKLALTADFDADLLERKVKKIERRLKDLEGDED